MQPPHSESPHIFPGETTREAVSPFAEIPVSSPRRPSAQDRWQSRFLLVGVTVFVVGTILGYYFLVPAPIDPGAPRVRLEVRGMHCPIQCGLRVTSSLERLPWVVPNSVTADPRTGLVTFAVTDTSAVEVESVRRAIECAGFGLTEVRLPQPE